MTTQVLCAGNVKIDVAQRQVFRDGIQVRLTKSERKLIELLASSPNARVPRAMMIERMFGSPGRGDEYNLRVLVSRIRKALGDDAKSPTIIKTIWGYGYQLVARSDLENKEEP